MRALKASRAIAALGVSAFLTFPAVADPGQPAALARTGDFTQYEKVPDKQLAKMRGGFVVPAGLLHFSVNLNAQINGQPIYAGSLTYNQGDPGVTDTVTVSTPFDVNGKPVTGDVRSGINQVVASVQAGNGNFAPGTFDGGTGFVATVQNTISNVAIQQEMRVRLDLSADHFLPSAAATALRNRLQQVGTLGILR